MFYFSPKIRVSKETALVFCEYFRNTDTKIASHGCTLIGDFRDNQDIIEVDEPKLFERVVTSGAKVYLINVF